MDALISIIIPVYNVQEFLDEAIQSVLQQTYSYLEIILVDDGVSVGVMCQCHTIVCTQKICMNYRIRSGSIMQASFSIKNLDKITFLSERVNYFLNKKYFEYCYGAYFCGMELISKAYLSSEEALINHAKEKYRTYRAWQRNWFHMLICFHRNVPFCFLELT